MIYNRENFHCSVVQESTQLAGLCLAGHSLYQLLSEAVADHAVEQEVGGRVEVLEHVSYVPGYVDWNAVVVPVEAFIIVPGPQDAICDKARKTKHDKGHRDSPQDENGSCQCTSGVPSIHDAPFLLSEEVAGPAQMVPNEVVEDDDQHNGDSSREEGSYPDYNCRIGVIAISTAGECHVLSVHG